MSASRPRRPEELLARRGGAVELLWLPAALFALLAGARRRLYDAGALRAARASVPVISVGNLTAGGTGKSPFVQWVVRELARRGVAAGVLSRGYKRAGGPGDEARAFAAKFPGVPLVEDPDRVRGARALAERGVGAIVLDDGFQHRRLARDLDVVLVDATRPFGLPIAAGERARPAPLPRGLMREPLAALARAHALVLTRVDQVAPDDALWLCERFERAAPGLAIAQAVHAPQRLGGARGEARELAWLAGREVDLVSGIGNPEAFERTATALGAHVVLHRRFPDHHAYAAGDFAALGERGRALVTTQKDLAKVAPHRPDALALEVEIELVSGAAPLAALLDGLCAAARGRRA